MNLIFRILIMTVSLSSFTCSTVPKPAADSPSVAAPGETGASGLARSELADSSIDIQYILGHDHYRFFAIVQGSSVTGNSTLNKRVLDQGKIDQNRYPDFFKKVSNFIRDVQKMPPDSLGSCRTPFTVVVKTGKQTETARGCRTNDGGALSKLIRDGEYLLYSKN